MLSSAGCAGCGSAPHSRFQREARIASDLGHPNIVEILDFNYTASGQPYIGAAEEHTSDIFSLGAVAYEALTGALPFQARTIPAVVYKVMNEEPAPPTTVNPALSPTVDPVIACALAKDRKRRYQRVEHFVAALGRSVGGSRGGPAGEPQGKSGGTMPAGSGMWRKT